MATCDQGQQGDLVKLWPDALLFIASDNKIVSMNHAAEGLLGWSADDLVGKTAHNILCSHIIGFEHGIEQCPIHCLQLDDNHTSSFDSLWVKQNAALMPVEVHKVPVSEAQTGANIVLSFNDCSARQHADYDYKRLNSFVELSPTFLLEIGDDMLIHFANPACIQLMAELDFSIEGRPLFLPENLEDIVHQCVKDNKSVSNIETQQDDRHFHWNFHPGTGYAEDRVHIYGTEVSKHKRDQEELTEHRSNLRDIVRNLVRTKTQDLHHRREIAENTNRSQANFFANLSHEVRTPLNGILGTTELLMENNSDDKNQLLLNQLHNSAQALSQLLTNMIEYTRSEGGLLQSEEITFSLRELIQQTVNMLRYSANERGNVLNIDINDNIFDTLKGDAEHLQELLLILTTNAIKATSNGKITLDIYLSHETNSLLKLKVEITDTGCGIEKDVLPTIFSPFSQASYGNDRSYEGRGLGLPLANSLVRSNGGNIGVKSEAGKGSTFWFTFLLEKQTDSTAQKPALIKPIAESRVAVLASAADAELVSRTLHSWKLDCSILTADESEEANKFDIVFAETDRLSPEFLTQTKNCLVLEIAEEQQNDSLPGLLKPISPSSIYDTLLAQLKLNKDAKNPLHLQLTPGNGERLLLVEDNEINRMIASSILKQLDYDVVTAENGNEALRLFQTGTFDLILMDCQMPEMDGFETTEEIRKLEKGQSHIPIVALTANIARDDRRRCLSHGMDDFISKPIQSKKLAAVIRSWITKGDPV